MALSEVEQRLLDTVVWYRNIQHETQHRRLIEDFGQVNPTDCDARSCKHANAVIDWCESYSRETP